MYSLRPKIIAILEFKICPTKMLTLSHLPQKISQFSEDSHKTQLTPHSLTTKDKGYFDNFTPTIGLRIWS